MKKLPVFCRAVCLAALLGSAAPAGELSGEVLTNADVVALVEAGLAPDLVRSKIEATPGVYDLSSRAMILLKQNNVPDDVLAAMMAAAEQPGSRPGLDAERYRSELEDIAYGSSQARTTAIAWMMANSTATFPALRQSLADPRAEIRSAAATVLSRAGDRDSLPAIRNLLTDSSTIVRGVAAQALVEMNDTSAVAAAEQAVLRQVSPVDGYARLVGHARLTQSAAALGEILARNPEAVNRVAAAWALGEIGRPGMAGRTALENAMLTDPDPDVRREAAQAIAKFHDAESAKLLEVACRQDPEVRKVTLAAMAEYPENMAFLVSVLGLGADQIAADELETARASLVRLTGQDFGQDGAGWADWYAANYQRFAQATPPLAAGGAGPMAPLGGGLPVTRAPEVDVMTWGIVADSAAIPMDPMVEAAGLADAAPSAAGGATAPGMPSLTGFSAYDGSAAVAAPGGGSARTDSIPFAIPDFAWDGGAEDTASAAPAAPTTPAAPAAAPATAPVLRTWSSEPSRVAGSPTGPAAPAASATPAAADDDQWSTPAAPSFDFPADLADSDGDFAAPAPAPTAAPAATAGLSTRPPEAAATSPLRPPPEELTGISLPIPPLGDGDDDWSAGSAAAPAAPTGVDPYAAMATPISPGMPTSPDDTVGGWSPPGFAGLNDNGGPDAEAFAASALPEGFEAGGGEDYEITFQPPGGAALEDAWSGDLFAAPQTAPDSVASSIRPPDSDDDSGGLMMAAPADEYIPPLPGSEAQAATEEHVVFQGGAYLADEPALPAPAVAAPESDAALTAAPLRPAEDDDESATAATGDDGDATAASATADAGDDDAWSIFVEPEPGQVVIGEPIMPGDVVVEHPVTPMPPSTPPSPAMAEAMPEPPPSVTVQSTPPAVTSSPTPSVAASPSAGSRPPAVVTPAPSEPPPRRGLFSRRSRGESAGQPRVDAVTGASLPRPEPVVSMPPSAVRAETPSAATAPATGPSGSPPSADGSHTVFNTTGLPPVNPEGLVTPRSGQAPPTLGEGFF